MSKLVEKFTKFTVQPRGFGGFLHRLLAVDPARSSGIPLNPQFRYPAPGEHDPNKYDDAVTLPAADLADNPYWKRDVRRGYPKTSVFEQSDVVALLTLGSKAAPTEGALKEGVEGAQQIALLQRDEGAGGLAKFFSREGQSETEVARSGVVSVLAEGGLPPSPTATGHAKVRPYELLSEAEQSYGEDYTCRSFK